MKRLFLHLTVLMLSFAPLVWGTVAFAITGGELDGDAHPNVGIILGVDPNNPDVLLLGSSGTLIHERVFLTAGHVTVFLESWIAAGGLVFVSFDSENALVNPPLAVEAAVTHPDFEVGFHPSSNAETSRAHDVGVLILKDPVTTITPQPLPPEGFLDQLQAEGNLHKGAERAKFINVGYGRTLEWPPPDIIPVDGKRRVSVSEFLNLREVWLETSQNMAPGREDGGICFGDSGGPAFWTEDDGTEILVAIGSWADSRCVSMSTRYRIDIPEALRFINEQMSAVNAAPPATRQVKRLATTWGALKQGK